MAEAHPMDAESIAALEALAMPASDVTLSPRGMVLVRARGQFDLRETVIAVPAEVLVHIVAQASASAIETLRRIAAQRAASS